MDRWTSIIDYDDWNNGLGAEVGCRYGRYLEKYDTLIYSSLHNGGGGVKAPWMACIFKWVRTYDVGYIN